MPKLSGILAVCRRLFWPVYKFKKATNGPLQPSSGIRSSKRRGRRVDLAIGQVVSLAREQGLALESFLLEKPPVGVRPIRRRAPQGVFDALIPWLVRKGYTPVETQRYVKSPTHGLMTYVDLVVTHPDSPDKLIFIEIKHGFERHLYRWCGHMSAPYQDKEDSPKNQHQIQLALTCALGGPSIDTVRSAVVQITGAGVVEHPLEPWAVDVLDHIPKRT